MGVSRTAQLPGIGCPSRMLLRGAWTPCTLPAHRVGFHEHGRERWLDTDVVDAERRVQAERSAGASEAEAIARASAAVEATRAARARAYG